MFKVSVPRKNIILEADPNKNLMDLLIENNLPVASSCLGEGICSKCVVQINPVGIHSELEIKTLTKNKRDLTDRLCCQVFVTCDMTVTTGYW
jgi:ferredoxin, 2Fe-2S